MAIGAAPVHADQDLTIRGSRSNSSLYYRLGGGNAASLSANDASRNLKFSLGGAANLNYSCGKLDIGAAYDYYLAQYEALADTLEAAITAAIMSLPLYILQRADPGLYEQLQSYWAKAQMEISAALKTCEEMEAQIKAGGDPYEDYANLAKGEGWKVNSSAGTNVLAAKANVNENGGKDGVNVFPGVQRGGEFQPPLRLVHDTTAVGYNAAMNLPPAASKDTSFPPTTMLGSLWATPRAAADWAVSVLGDQEVATCDESDCGTGDLGGGKAVATGLGLKPKYEAAQASVGSVLNTMVNGATTATYAELQAISAPGVAINQELIEAMRALPSGSRAAAAQRLASEIALSQTIDRALALRNLLLTGISALNYDKPADDTMKRVTQLNRYIDDLLFETRVRKEVVSNTAQLLIESYRTTGAARSSAVPAGEERTSRPLEDGAVK